MKTLYIIPSLISEGNKDLFFPPNNLTFIKNTEAFFVENLRTARRFLRYLDNTFPIDDKHFLELNKHYDNHDAVINLLKDNRYRTYGIISEAGYPGIADPGSFIVKKAHELNIKVIPLTGPSSLFMALSSSGLNGQNFCFHGYLPVKSPALFKKIKQLEIDSKKHQKTQIFIETPYRNQALFQMLTKTLQEDTLLCIACDIGSAREFIYTQPVKNWKKQKVDIHKRPAVFLLQAGN